MRSLSIDGALVPSLSPTDMGRLTRVVAHDGGDGLKPFANKANDAAKRKMKREVDRFITQKCGSLTGRA